MQLHPTQRYLLFFAANFFISKSKPRKFLDLKKALENLQEKHKQGQRFKYEAPPKLGERPRYSLSLKDIKLENNPAQAFLLLSICDREAETVHVDENTLDSHVVPRTQGVSTGREALFAIKLNKGSGGYVCILEKAAALSKAHVSAALQSFFKINAPKAAFLLSPLSNMKLLDEAMKGKLTAVKLSKQDIAVDGLSGNANFKPKSQTLSLSPPVTKEITEAFTNLFHNKKMKEEGYSHLKIAYSDKDGKSHSKIFNWNDKNLLEEAVQRKEMIFFKSPLKLDPQKIDDLQPLKEKMSKKLEEN